MNSEDRCYVCWSYVDEECLTVLAENESEAVAIYIRAIKGSHMLNENVFACEKFPRGSAAPHARPKCFRICAVAVEESDK